MPEVNIDDLAAIFHAARFRSRRLAKRECRERLGDGSAATLDRVLQHIDNLPKPTRDLVHARAAAIEQAIDAAIAGSVGRAPDDSETWLIALSPASEREYLVHTGEFPFVAEIVPDDTAGSVPIGDGDALLPPRWLAVQPDEADAQRLLHQAAHWVQVNHEYGDLLADREEADEQP